MAATKKDTTRPATQLRELLKAKTFLHMPAVYDPIGAQLVEQSGFKVAYVGGYVTSGSRAISLNRC
jgi:2-methylisocitrate lyase-like PEP mutase family enzyme